MFTDPHWLILLIPAVWYMISLKLASRKLFVLRLCLIVLVLLAMAGLQLRLPGREGVIVVVADRSLSMPANSDLRVNETLALLKKHMPVNAKLGLVSFADEARVEMAPARSSFTGFAAEINQESSNLDEGISRAVSLIPGDLSGRLIVISDGLWSGKNPEQSAFHAANRGIPIDYRLLSRELSADMAITSFDVPGILSPGEAFMASADVFSPDEQLAQMSLQCSGRLIASFSRQLKSGSNNFLFSLTAPTSSVARYLLTVAVPAKDPFPENNQAMAISEVSGKKPLLVIADSNNSAIYALLKKAGHQVELLSPLQIAWSIEFLAGYSAIIIENISANRITMHGMQVIAAWVRHLGGGMLMTGGKNSYGNGGYYKSPLEPVLPVSLELRSEHRKLALAMMVVLDRSGSMAAPARGGRTKMDLANIAAASSLDLLSPLDEFGLLAVDTEAHEVVPLQIMTEKEKWREKILHIESTGGGIYVYEGISKAAEMLLKAEAKTRHIILFADACDSEEPGRYWELLEKATNAGLTLSVIGLGTEADPDANLLRKIATAGKGRIFFTREPEELPRLFTQDTFVAARSTFIEESAPVETLAAIKTFAPDATAFKSEIGAYNLCYPREDADVAARIVDENKAPLLSTWQCGLGRVACYTGVVDGDAAGQFISQLQAAEIFTGVCNWIALDDRQNIGEMQVTQQISKGRWQATVHLDPDREREFFRDTPEIEVMRSFLGREPQRETIKMTWETADSLAAELILRGNEVITGMIRTGDRKMRLPPICQLYAQEHAPAGKRNGGEELKELAAITGGRELIDLGRAWESMPSTVQYRNLSGELLFLALFIFLAEVAERRTAVFTLLLNRWRQRKTQWRIPGRQAKTDFATVDATTCQQDTAMPMTATATTDKALITPLDGPATTSFATNLANTLSTTDSETNFSEALKKAKKQAGKHTRS